MVLNNATQETDNPDLRDRAYVYWRLLSTDPEVCHLIGKSGLLLHMLLSGFKSCCCQRLEYVCQLTSRGSGPVLD